MAALWPTPSASNPNDTEDPESWRARQATLRAKHGNNGAGEPLAIVAREMLWPTATATDARGSGSAAYDSPKAGTTLTDAVRGLSPGRQGPPIVPPGHESSLTTPTSLRLLRLNPHMVEWLMGFPPHHTLPLED